MVEYLRNGTFLGQIVQIFNVFIQPAFRNVNQFSLHRAYEALQSPRQTLIVNNVNTLELLRVAQDLQTLVFKISLQTLKEDGTVVRSAYDRFAVL